MPEPLQRRGPLVWVRTVHPQDLPDYRTAVIASADRLGRWNPVDPDDLGRHLNAQSVAHRTFVIHANEPTPVHGIVGKVNVSNVVRGRFHNGTLGYDAYDPYAGTGLFAEGLRMVLDLAFAAEPEGMGLHRVEANVQPGNVTSAGVLRSLGFRREGHVRQMLWLSGPDGNRWRDHDTHALTASEWPATAYAHHAQASVVALVVREPGASSQLSRALSAELAVPLVRTELVGPVWPQVVADSPVGAVVDFALTRAGVSATDCGPVPDRAALIWCADAAPSSAWARLHRIDEPTNPSAREVTRIALLVRAHAVG